MQLARVRVAPLAEDVAHCPGNALADFAARDHSATTRAMAAFKTSMAVLSSASWGARRVVLAMRANWLRLLPMALSSNRRRFASGLRRAPPTVAASAVRRRQSSRTYWLRRAPAWAAARSSSARSLGVNCTPRWTVRRSPVYVFLCRAIGDSSHMDQINSEGISYLAAAPVLDHTTAAFRER